MKWCTLVSLMLCLRLCAGEGDSEHARALPLLQRVMEGDESALIPAVVAMSKAAELFETSGEDNKAQEANACLFWLKKRMNLQQIGALATAKGVNSVALKKIETIDNSQPTEAAQAYYDRAEAFARANPNEHLRIAIRYFEVADRFAGSPLSIKAQQFSLEAMQKIKVSSVQLPPANMDLNSIEAIAKAWNVLQPALAKSKEKYIRNLESALKTETARGNLESSAQIQEEIQLMNSPVIRTMTTLQSSTARSAQAAYMRDVESARRPYLAALNAEIPNQVKKGNLELAKKIQEELANDKLLADYGWILGTWITERYGPWEFTIENNALKLREPSKGRSSKQVIPIAGNLLVHWANGNDAFFVSRENDTLMFSMYLTYFSSNPVKPEKPKGTPNFRMKMTKQK